MKKLLSISFFVLSLNTQNHAIADCISNCEANANCWSHACWQACWEECTLETTKKQAKVQSSKRKVYKFKAGVEQDKLVRYLRHPT